LFTRGAREGSYCDFLFGKRFMNDSMLQPAAGALRDQFLASLDDIDNGRTVELAGFPRQCANPLPSVTCVRLGLPAGSTYGHAARHLLDGK